MGRVANTVNSTKNGVVLNVYATENDTSSRVGVIEFSITHYGTFYSNME